LRALDPPPVELRWQSKRVPFLSSVWCPPNLARTIAESSGYAWAKSSDGLWLNLYGGNKLKPNFQTARPCKSLKKRITHGTVVSKSA